MKLKSSILVSIIIILVSVFFYRAEIFVWYTTPSHTYDFGEGIVVDSAGNLYVTGYTSGNFYGNVNAGGSDVFLMKLNSSGIIQ